MTKADTDTRIAVKLERNFWQLVVALAFFFGLFLGGGLIRCGLHRADRTQLDVPMVLKVHMLEAELKRCKP